MKKLACIALLVLLAVISSLVLADEAVSNDSSAAPLTSEQVSAEETVIAKKIQNPLSGLVILPLSNTTQFQAGPGNKYTFDSLVFTPTFPTVLSEHFKLVHSIGIPLNTLPNFNNAGQANGYNVGLGNISYALMFADNDLFNLDKWTFGIGGRVSAPTASNASATTNKMLPTANDAWSLGPQCITVYRNGPLVVGGFLDQMWSVSGSTPVDLTQFHAVFNYNFGGGFSVNCVPYISFDWTKPPGEQLTMPLGAGIGKVFLIKDKLPISVSAQYYYNIIHSQDYPLQTVTVQVAMVLPERIFANIF